MNYVNALPMSYMVPTFYPTPPGTVTPQGDAPLITLPDPDLRARAQRFVNVLYWTAKKLEQKKGIDDKDTLKIFAAPEFYFRRARDREVSSMTFASGTSFGSYPERARYQLAEALYGAIHGSPLFTDWVIVAGTICSALPPDGEGRLRLLNTAIMLRGRRATPDSSPPYILMEKHYISNLDGPPAEAHANRDESTVFSFRLNPDQILDNLIFWDGMLIGLEVCLDHAEQVVRNALMTLEQSVGFDSRSLDLQLVTSCAMSIIDESTAVRDGGLIMLTDGDSRVPYGLPEPRFQLGRFDAGTRTVRKFPAASLEFAELPGDDNYSVDYCLGNYADLGRRQGIWTTNDPIPLHAAQHPEPEASGLG